MRPKKNCPCERTPDCAVTVPPTALGRVDPLVKTPWITVLFAEPPSLAAGSASATGSVSLRSFDAGCSAASIELNASIAAVAIRPSLRMALLLRYAIASPAYARPASVTRPIEESSCAPISLRFGSRQRRVSRCATDASRSLHIETKSLRSGYIFRVESRCAMSACLKCADRCMEKSVLSVLTQSDAPYRIQERIASISPRVR